MRPRIGQTKENYIKFSYFSNKLKERLVPCLEFPFLKEITSSQEKDIRIKFNTTAERFKRTSDSDWFRCTTELYRLIIRHDKGSKKRKKFY